ncbi:MAG TPA: DUF5675 family protein [Geobacterales bacterium]|nr:DUF5675 family protein [Geobacterales bacterium]
MTTFTLARKPDDGENERTRGLLTCPAVPEADALKIVTLERPWLNNQPKVSCIPAGTYQVVISLSPKFGRLMPRLLNVPGRSEIECHWGNVVTDTEGCIIVGTSETPYGVAWSRLAFGKFFPWLTAALKSGDVFIAITNSAPEPMLAAQAA